MKFSNIILTATLTILLLDTSFVLGKKPRKGRGKGPGKRGKLIENQCEALESMDDGMVDKRECMQTLNCDVENKVCINFAPTVCGEITDPTKEDCRKNGCLFVEGVGSGFADTCEDKLIDNQCGAIESTDDGKVDRKECMQTLNCDVANEGCIAYVLIACDKITVPTKKDCRKNGCLFVEGATCEVDPCIATCLEEDNNTCCLKRCQTVDKCSKANSKQGKCEKKKKKNNKEECVYDSETNVCSQAAEGCVAFNGQQTDCDAAEEGCVYDACTEQCSKE